MLFRLFYPQQQLLRAMYAEEAARMVTTHVQLITTL